MKLTARDLIFAAINGAFIGILAPYIFANLSVKLPVSQGVFAFIIALLSAIGVAVGYLLSRIKPFFFELAKFGLIGVANTIIDLGLFNLFIYFSHISDGYIVSIFKSLSVLAAIISSFIWNKYWSFAKKDSANVKEEFAHFLMVSLIGLLLNVGITSFIINVITIPAGIPDKAWANVGALTASALVLTWNFVGYKFFVFKKRAA